MDFMVECAIRDAKPEPQEVRNPSPDLDLLAWTVHINRSSKPKGDGAGLVLIEPDGIIVEYIL